MNIVKWFFTSSSSFSLGSFRFEAPPFVMLIVFLVILRLFLASKDKDEVI